MGTTENSGQLFTKKKLDRFWGALNLLLPEEKNYVVKLKFCDMMPGSYFITIVKKPK